MKTMNNYIGDELAHKVKVLSQALNEARTIISKLEEENNLLKDALMNITSINKEYSYPHSEAMCA
jgi:hypothetical protein